VGTAATEAREHQEKRFHSQRDIRELGDKIVTDKGIK
jgi:hypothetical protein